MASRPDTARTEAADMAAYRSSPLKRGLDLILILVFSPVILIVIVATSIILLLGQGWPLLFAQERAGLGGKPFKLLKFRTMKIGGDPYGPSPKDGSDARLTGVGKLIRAVSLDELPQFWNVICGQMSLVGPRPLYVSQIEEWSKHQRRRLEVRPGLTGLAQISGRGGLTIEQKLDLDVKYVEQQNLWLDLKILLRTFVKLLRSDDIYEKRYSEREHTRGAGE